MKTLAQSLLIALSVCLATSAGATVRYVDGNSTTPTAPYTTWATAAATIQDAVDAAVAGDEIIVTNGIYAAGGRPVGTNALVNRVAVDKPLTLRSVNGPQFTVIQGYQIPGTTNGDGAIRCVYLTNGASLLGFTLTNGATRTVGGYYGTENSGGGVLCESMNEIISNCVFVANSAAMFGGGSYRGTLNNCILTGNSAEYGGGANAGLLNRCMLIGNWAKYAGGGAGGFYTHLGGVRPILNHCELTGNWAADYGGGAWWATLSSCTLNGNSAGRYGGGAGDSTLNSCTLSSNSIVRVGNLFSGHGGGASVSTLNGCVVTRNWAPAYGGGVTFSTLNNCTITGNSAGDSSGGVAGSKVNYCIVYYNIAPTFANYSDSSTDPLNYCCTTPLPTNGIGNIALDPQLASVSHLSSNSPCLGPPTIGRNGLPGAATGPLIVRILAPFTNVAVGYSLELSAIIEGRTTASMWDFGDGHSVSNQPHVTHTWMASGDYPVILKAFDESVPGGVNATATVHVVTRPVHYVAANSANPLPPYTSWATAAANIQDAVDEAFGGSEVVVSNGVYATGGRAVFGAMTNRLVVDKPLTVRSLNGPQFTVIEGNQVPGTTNGDAAVRCVYLTDGARLSGFTLTKGATRTAGYHPEKDGGGLWCVSTNAVVFNCVVTGNSAGGDGGGTFGGTFYNCILSENSAVSGGGVANFQTSRKTVLNNCTLVGNRAIDSAGGVKFSSLNNCIVYYNTAPKGANYGGADGEGGSYSTTLNYCSTMPQPDFGSDNFTTPPLFVNQAGGNFHLQAISPCINAGNNVAVSGSTDLDGNPRIVGGTVDIGAYEFQSPQSTISYAWLQQFGLPINGTTDTSDSDNDGHNTWQEWRADTLPTNALSALRMLLPTASASGARVSWQSVSTRMYWLERASSLTASPVFSTIASNLLGQLNTTTYSDTNVIGSGPFFYRVGVQP